MCGGNAEVTGSRVQSKKPGSEAALVADVPTSSLFSRTGRAAFWLIAGNVESFPLVRISRIPISPLDIGELPYCNIHDFSRDDSDDRSFKESWHNTDILPGVPN